MVITAYYYFVQKRFEKIANANDAINNLHLVRDFK